MRKDSAETRGVEPLEDGKARIQVFKVDAEEAADLRDAGRSKQLPENELFASVASKTVSPRFDISKLAIYPEYSTTLSACIDAMRTNIDGFGHLLIPRKGVEKSKSLAGKAEDERIRLLNFFQYAYPEGSWQKLRKRTRKHLEATGNAYWEILRSTRGEITGIDLIAPSQIRLGLESDDILASRPVIVATRDGYKLSERKEWRRFRTFVQGKITGIGGKLRWFKQLGDPRTYDNETGQIVSEEQIKSFGNTGRPMPESRKASEIYHWKISAPETPYGVPRYVSCVLAIVGSRKAGEINYKTFKSNNVPSLAVLVSGGELTEASVKRVHQYVQAQVRESDNYSTILLLEGESDFDGVEGGKVKIEIIPLTGAQIQDALFINYLKHNSEELREVFRMPPIFIGRAETYNKSTAETSRKLGDEQLFAPEREDTDWVINTEILARMGVVYTQYRSRTPNVTDNKELIQMATAIERAGGMTPRIARMITADVFPVAEEAPPIEAARGIDPDTSISYQTALILQGQQDPMEPNQNVAPTQPSGKVGFGKSAKSLFGEDDYWDLLVYQTAVDEELNRFLRGAELPSIHESEDE